MGGSAEEDEGGVKKVHEPNGGFVLSLSLSLPLLVSRTCAKNLDSISVLVIRKRKGGFDVRTTKSRRVCLVVLGLVDTSC